MKSYVAIGLMSGTSLDGVDVAFCRFNGRDDLWQYEILQAETISYSDNWQKKLRNARNVTAQDLIKLHAEYGRLLGKMAKNFIDRHRLSPGFIASHGHTVFHQPAGGFTFQLGNGAEIAAITGKTVVCDFRTTDIAHGGQGAPLVPVGDHMLFGDYDYCLNLGGFANVSVCKNGERLAWDICPVNIVLNHLSRQRGLPFDKNGKLARKGTTDKTLLKKLNRIAFYHQKGPKSLGAEWLDKTFLPLLAESDKCVEDLLNTVVEHAAMQIAKSFDSVSHIKILVTGGGAYNDYLTEKIAFYCGSKCDFIIPESKVIEYKEAMIFAFLGLLRLTGKPNTFKSVTGARSDSIGGAVYLGETTKNKDYLTE